MMRKAAILLLLFWSVRSELQFMDAVPEAGVSEAGVPSQELSYMDAVSAAAESEVFEAAAEEDFSEIEVGLAKDNDLGEAFGMVEDAVDLRRSRRSRWKKAVQDAKKRRFRKALIPCHITCFRNRFCKRAILLFNARKRKERVKNKAAEIRVWNSMTKFQKAVLKSAYVPCVVSFYKQERLLRIYGRCGYRCYQNKLCRSASQKFDKRLSKFSEFKEFNSKTFKSLSPAQKRALTLAFRPCYRQAWREAVAKIWTPCFVRCGRSAACRAVASKFKGAKSKLEKRRRWRNLPRREQLVLASFFGPCLTAYAKELDRIKKVVYKPCQKKCRKSWGCSSAMKKWRQCFKAKKCSTKKAIYARWRKMSWGEKLGSKNAFKSCKKRLRVLIKYLKAQVKLPIDLIATV